MEEGSLVSKARTAFHSAAAKAERVFTDIKKSDSTSTTAIGEDSHKQSPDTSKKTCVNGNKSCHEVKILKWRTSPIKLKQDWHERFKNIRIGKKEVEDIEKSENSAMSFAIFDENLYQMSPRDGKGSKLGSSAEGLSATNAACIPSAVVMKQLAMAIESGKQYKSIKDLLASSRDSSPVRERTGLNFTAMKSLVLREKEEKFTNDFGADEKVLALITPLLEAEGHFTGRKTGSDLERLASITTFPKDIHGAPPESFVVKLSEAIGSLKTLRKMASFWCKIVAELRRLWSEGQYIPGIPPDETPDLNSCLLYQQLQVINCCVSRKRRHSIATESLDYVIGQASSNGDAHTASEGISLASPILYARISTGELVLRLGADKLSDNLTMLETGELVYTPIMQEGPLLTEDVIKETEEFVLRTGSVGAGCSQLLSDMQAFKAANPGCILEDFVRWHSPPDWMEAETNNEAKENFYDSYLLSAKGHLSSRMQKEGNLWHELWETAKPLPAVRQSPLFDEDLAVEGILNFFEDISPSELFEQLFVSLLGSGFVIAEVTLSTSSSLSKLFNECKDYIVSTCQSSSWVEKVDDIIQVYKTVDMMLLNPDEAVKITNHQPEETSTSGEPKNRFKRLSLIFGGNDKHWGKPPPKDEKNSEENPTRHTFSSIFSKKPPKPSSASSPDEKRVCSIENDWTVI